MTVEKLAPRPYQAAAIEKALAEPTHGVLVASGLGSGKTLVATEIALRLALPRVLVIAPRNTLAQWIERFAAQSDGAVQVRRLDSTKRGREAFADFMAGAPGYYCATSQWLVAQDFSYEPAVDPNTGEPIYKVVKSTGEVALDKNGDPIQETMRTHLKTFAKPRAAVDVVIFDEFHSIQNRKSLTTRTVNTLRTDWRIGMSGTWTGNSFEGAWSTAKWVWPGERDGEKIIDSSFHRWVAEWCETEDVYVPGKDKPVSKVVGEKGEAGTFAAQLPCYILDEPFPQPPAAVGVYVDLTSAQRAQYTQLEEEAIAWVRDHEGIEAPVVADLPIVLRQRLRTATLGEMSLDAEGEIFFDADCTSAKITALRGVLDSFDRKAGRKEPAVIFTDSRRFAHVVAERMNRAGYRALAWTGDASEKQRMAMKEQFLAGEQDYIVATIPALSEGLDGLQYRCSKIVWLSRSENQLKNDQSAARIWRPGVDQDAFMQVDILARDTLDEGTFSRLAMTRHRNRLQMGAAV